MSRNKKKKVVIEQSPKLSLPKIEEEYADNKSYTEDNILPSDNKCNWCLDGGCLWSLSDGTIKCGHCGKEFYRKEVTLKITKIRTMHEMVDDFEEILEDDENYL